MENEFEHAPSNEEAISEMTEVRKEVFRLFDFAEEKHKKELDEAGAEFTKEREEIDNDILAGKEPKIDTKDVIGRFFERINKSEKEYHSTIKKVYNDAVERLKDITVKGLAEKYFSEISPEEWKKFFGDL